MLIKYSSKLKYYFSNQMTTWISLFFVIFSFIWGMYKIFVWPLICYSVPLSDIVITGNRYFTNNDNIYNLISSLGMIGTFITQDVNIIQKKIKNLPWVNKVSVRKQWPDTLKIHIVEYMPMAYWNDKLILSTMGVFFPFPVNFRNDLNHIDIFKNIPYLYGPIGEEKNVLTNYLIFDAILQSVKFQLKSVKMDICYSWQIVLEDDITLRLGRKNFVEKLCYFLEIYPVLLQKMNKRNKFSIDYVDLRYISGFSVHWVDNSNRIIFCNK